MKKNMFLRVASVLLVLTLLSTCAISGTFAKYVTSADNSDEARVAKFGVEITATSDSLFEMTYASDTADYAANTVVAQENVVAPGTSGTLTGVTISGTPEVAVAVTYESTVTLTGWTDAAGADYCPVIFTVGGETYGMAGSTATNPSSKVTDLAAALKTAIDNVSAEYAAGADLSAATAPAIEWAWAYDVASGDTNQTDVKDTYLGDQAAAGNAAGIKIELTTTVTQID